MPGMAARMKQTKARINKIIEMDMGIFPLIANASRETKFQNCEIAPKRKLILNACD